MKDFGFDIKDTKKVTTGALIASVYVALSLLLHPISFGAVQFRVAEAMTLLPILFPEAIPGLFVGCLLTNLFSAYGLLDIVIGSLATLAAALLTRKLRFSVWLAAIPPILINAVAVGALIALSENIPVIPTMLMIGAEEAVSVLVLGPVVVTALGRIKARASL